MSFQVGQRVYWTTDSRHIRGTVIETDVPTNLDKPGDRSGIRVAIDECDRRPSWGEEPRGESEVWPAWSARLRPLT
jgi:hypothetical protein